MRARAIVITALGLFSFACGAFAGSEAVAGGVDRAALEAIVAGRDEAGRARDTWRHPVDTLAFLGVEPSDFVIEVIPGSGWYTDIIAPYVAEKGRYGAVFYEYEMYEAFVINPTEERFARIRAYPTAHPKKVAEKYALSEAPIAFYFGGTPEDIHGQVDSILVFRAMHNYFRVGGNTEFLERTLADFNAMLKPGGILGVVQHRAPEDSVGPASDGTFGYLKQSEVIKLFEDAGFVFEEATEINANPADNAGPNDFVWRLPPFLYFGDKEREKYEAIGESDRMTLRFRKPGEK